jgi:uncharacterized protein YjiS (DUF1127 family)
MSTISSAHAPARFKAKRSPADRLAAVFGRMWVAYITWRLEQAIINQLESMSDRDLKDIGFTRSEIVSAVKGDLTRDRGYRISLSKSVQEGRRP